MTSSKASAQGATVELAAFASRLRYADIPAGVIAKAKLCLLDTVGCCIYGSTLAPVRKLLDMVLAEGAHPVASILGTSDRVAPSQAALVNAASAHAFQLDEVHAGATLHPGSVVVPAALALSDAAGGVSGETFLAAMIAGYETGIRVGIATRGGMFKRGYHNQGTTGTVAAAAAAARILGLDTRATMHALGLAASQSAGLMAVQEGANAKAFHSGRASQSGVYAALLAKAGYTGIEHVFDVDYGGFFSTLVDGHDPAALALDLGRRWETLEVGFKSSPASNGSITAMHTLARIMRENALATEDIERVSASVSTNTLEHCGWEFDPAAFKGVLAAQMNLRYGLSVMAVDRVATPAQFTEDRIKSPDVAAFLRRIDVRVREAYDRNPALRLACALEVRTKAGRTLTGETLYRPGSAEDPMSPEDLERKFLTLAAAAVSNDAAGQCMAHIKRLEHEAHVAISR
jgi:2-methylcitrate dehydratase PrpD